MKFENDNQATAAEVADAKNVSANQSSNSMPLSPKKLSKGALIGIVAGCAVAIVLGIILFFIFNPSDSSGGNTGNEGGKELCSDTLYVQQVENMPEDFIMGMDASCVPALEASGVKYYDHDGNEKDVYQILSENGINYIRVRIWNDPFDKDGNGYGGGNCDLENAIEVGKRATKYGMKLFVNFHYSDFWADPAKQQEPKAWRGMDSTEMSDALYEYTKESLQKLVDAGVDIGMVQVGNETTGSMCGFSSWLDITKLMKAGSKAVREVCPNALVAIHFTNPEKVTNYSNYAYYLGSQKVDYDVFASSYYPAWHGTLENLTTVLNKVADTYGKKTMIIETAYANTTEDTDFFGNSGTDGVKSYPFTEQGQANHIRELTDAAVNKMSNCIGICYWEGTWISVGGETWEENSAIWEKYGSGWASSYAKEYDPADAGKYYGGCSIDNQAFFDATGKARESLKVFGLVRKGNVVDNLPDAIQDVDLIIDLNGDVVLPGVVNAVMRDNSKNEIPVTWNKMAKIENYVTGDYTDIDYSIFKEGGIAKYEVVGEAGGMIAKCYVSMVEYNFLNNWSFEDDSADTSWTSEKLVDFAELYVEDKVSDSLTGTKHYHFWGSSPVEFTLEQEVANLKGGTYKLTMSTMGGDMGNYESYIYVKINGEIAYSADAKFTVYDEWFTSSIPEFTYNEGDSLVIGIYVKADSGAWGKIDDAMLNSVME